MKSNLNAPLLITMFSRIIIIIYYVISELLLATLAEKSIVQHVTFLRVATVGGLVLWMEPPDLNSEPLS